MPSKKHKKKPSKAQNAPKAGDAPSAKDTVVLGSHAKGESEISEASSVEESQQSAVQGNSIPNIDANSPERLPEVPEMESSSQSIEVQAEAQENVKEVAEVPQPESMTESLPIDDPTPVSESMAEQPSNELEEISATKAGSEGMSNGQMGSAESTSQEAGEPLLEVGAIPEKDTSTHDTTVQVVPDSSPADLTSEVSSSLDQVDAGVNKTEDLAKEAGEPIPDASLASSTTNSTDQTSEQPSYAEAVVSGDQEADSQTQEAEEQREPESEPPSSDMAILPPTAEDNKASLSETNAQNQEEEADPDLSLSNPSPLPLSKPTSSESTSNPSAESIADSNQSEEQPAIQQESEQADLQQETDPDLSLSSATSDLSKPSITTDTSSSSESQEPASSEIEQQEDPDLALSSTPSGDLSKLSTQQPSMNQEQSSQVQSKQEEEQQADPDLSISNASGDLSKAQPPAPEAERSSIATTEDQADADLALSSASGDLSKPSSSENISKQEGSSQSATAQEVQEADPDLSLSKTSNVLSSPEPTNTVADEPSFDVDADIQAASVQSTATNSQEIDTEASSQEQEQQADPDLSLSSATSSTPLGKQDAEGVTEEPVSTQVEDAVKKEDLIASTQPYPACKSTFLPSRPSASDLDEEDIEADIRALAISSVAEDESPILAEDTISSAVIPPEPVASSEFLPDGAAPQPSQSSYPPFSTYARKPSTSNTDKRETDSNPDAPSLTMSIIDNLHSPSVPWRRRILTIFASLGINLFLPFVNGVMLGFGEIFAREWVSIYFGIGPHSKPGAPTRTGRANTSSVGIRAAGERGGGNVRPGNAAEKTLIETAAESMFE